MGDKSAFRIFSEAAGHESAGVLLQEPSIYFMVEGEVALSYKNLSGCTFAVGQFVLIPPGIPVDVKVILDAKVVRCWFNTQLQLCEYFRLDLLEPLGRGKENEHHTLSINETLELYLKTIEAYIAEGFLCSCLHRYKQQELFHLLRAYYSRQDLAAFFAPILNEDMFFKDGVLKNHPHVNKVAELASRMNYSTSGFKKKFERCFGQSPFSWLREQKASAILHDLKENKINNKEIIDRYGFSSKERFYEFCRRVYGRPPGEIRSSGELSYPESPKYEKSNFRIKKVPERV